jgi:hypothetical protein
MQSTDAKLPPPFIGDPELNDPKPRKTRTPKETATVVSPPEPEDDGLGEEPAKVYTVEEIRAIGRENGTRVGVDKVRTLIKEMGAESLPKMDASLYNDFVDRVTKLK